MGNSPTPTFKQVNKVNVQEIAPLLQRCYVPAQGESLYWRFHDSHLTMEISVHSSFFYSYRQLLMTINDINFLCAAQ